MPAFGDSYRTSNTPYQKTAYSQQQNQPQAHFQHSQRSISPPDVPQSFSPPKASGFGGKAASAHFSTVPGVGSGGVGGNPKHRIYPKELSNPAFKPNSGVAASPLLSAFNPADLFGRSFLSGSPGTNSTAPSSLTGGSPPNSWPASYQNNGSLPRGAGGSVPHQRLSGTYPSFEEQLSRNGRFMNQHMFSNNTGVSGDSNKLTPGDGGYACSFDTLDGDSENVVCLGWEGGIDVWRVGKGSLDLIGRLEGLSGGVKSAKILPTPQRGDPLAAMRPLIALTIQTPIYASNDGAASPASSGPSRPRSAASFSSSRSHNTNHGANHSAHSQEVEWQTSVEIYSLSTRERVAVLFTSPPEPSPNTSANKLTSPSIWGGIRVEVGDKSIAVGLGISGEVYLFTLISIINETQPPPGIGNEAPRKHLKGKGSVRRKSAQNIPSATEIRGEWVCQGKVWTTVNIATSGSIGSDGNVTLNPSMTGAGLGFFQNGTPIFSLEGRWLSYLPPPANSSISAGGTVRVSHGLAAASVMTHTPPPPPAVTAQVDTSDGEETLINRMAREATQEVLRGAKWVGEHGMKAWQNYWGNANTPGAASTGPNHSPPLPSNLNGGMGMAGFSGVGGGIMSPVSGVSALGQQLQRERQMQQMLGSPYINGGGNTPSPYANQSVGTPPSSHTPSMGNNQPQSGGYTKSAMHGPNDPMLVSIFDLGRFPSTTGEVQAIPNQGSQLSPFATFQPPLGVGYLSFAPGGLALLTVSSKGDVYCVWDLMRVVHKPATGPGGAAAPQSSRYVRQIARFTRMTVARTIDVVWSFPRGDRFAVVTDRGTVHFYDLPYNAYQWPPFKKPPPSSASSNVSPVTQQAAGMVQAVQGAVNLIGTTTQPLLTAARMRRPSVNAAKIPSPPGGITVNYGNTRAREISTSLAGSSGGSKGSHMPSGVSKISLPGNPSLAAPGLVKFLIGKEKGKVCLMGGGVLHVYQKNSGGVGGSKKRRSMTVGGILPESGVAYDLPGLPDNQPFAKREHGDEDQLIDLDKVVGGHWSGKHHHQFYHHGTPVLDGHYRRRDEHQQYVQHPLSFAEIETNPSYTAFHNDRRVTLMVYSETAPVTATSSMMLQHPKKTAMTAYDANAPWVFGLPVQAEKLNLGGGKGEVEFIQGGALEDVADAMESKLKLSANLLPSLTGSEEGLGGGVGGGGAGERKKRWAAKRGGKKAGAGGDEKGFFEDDCVLDFTAGV
ncbi:hypothetical protein DFH27DRAFT_606808 [Peziza echinospora]|nr:hypothetical protein DFH27DRAFT_606808 [Peziza echinospora]